jgi:hypothetical protein
MGTLAGVISYDENVKNQFKYTNTIGYTNRTSPRPLIPGAAPNTPLTPPAAPSTQGLRKIRKSMIKIATLLRAGNVPEFATSFMKSILDLVDLLLKHF